MAEFITGMKRTNYCTELSAADAGKRVTVNGWELGEGLYLYSLVVNGREIDTKKMIITN